MLTISFILVAWLIGFLIIINGLERAQHVDNGIVSVSKERQMLFGWGLVAYIGISFLLAIAYIF